MAMIHIKAKLVLFLSLFSLFFVSSVYGGTYFVDTHGINSTGDGRSGSPWKTIAYALTKVKYGDTISINDGIYSEGQLIIPAGVSLTSSSQDNTKVKLQPNTSLSIKDPFILLSSTPGSNGNQTISYLEIDGINGAYKAYIGIQVKSRDNVRIHHCNIHDFYGQYYAACVSVESVEISPTNQWWNYWPADAQALGTDTNIDALWPDNPVDSFELDNNVITEGGYKDGSSHTTGAVQIWHLKDSTIHHNTITTTTTSKGQCITGKGLKTALLDNVDIYNNTFNNYVHSDKDNFALETWVHKGGCQIYNNNGTGWYSVTVGKGTIIYDNTLTISPPETHSGIGIEFNMQSYGEVYGNYIENAKWGIVVGFSYAGSKNWITKNVTVRNNAIYNSNNSCIWVSCLAPKYSGLKPTVKNIDVYSNVMVGKLPRGSFGIAVSETSNESTCSLSNVNLKRNIITGMKYSAGKTDANGSVDNLVIDDNNFYGNVNNRWEGSTATNTNTSDPGINLKPTLGSGGNILPTGGIDTTSSDPVIVDNTDAAFSKPTLGSGGNIPPTGGIDTPSSDPVIVDNTDPGCSFVGSWGTSSFIPGFYGSNYRWAATGSGTNQATWSFSVTAGQYDLSAQWSADSGRATNATYRVYNNGVEIGAQVFNQRVNGGRFNVFDTTFTVSGGTLTVELTDDADGGVIADAVKVVLVPISPPNGFKIGIK